MTLMERLALSALHKFDAETAHNLSIKALQLGLVTPNIIFSSARLKCKIAGLNLPNPIGLAAGFDKNAHAITALSRLGFGFIEVGGITPRPQSGHQRPRLFRLDEDQAVINRFGFNNAGMNVIAKRLKQRPHSSIVGVNLGVNQDSTQKADHYIKVLKTCGNYIDFATINVSCPNSDNLQKLRMGQGLDEILSTVMNTRTTLKRWIPLFLKISPDLTDDGIENIAEVAKDNNIDGIIATNTTLQRKNLRNKNSVQSGGLSGQPLFEQSTRVLAQLSRATEGKIPLIGVGGISSAEQAFAKIKAGATAVQLYTALIYKGFSLVNDIAREIDRILLKNQFPSMEAAIGTDIDAYL